MALLDISTWSFAPSWSDDLLESLEWLTDIMQSPTGAEQRRCLRWYPRRTFEFDIAVKGVDRSKLDSFLMKHGARDFYLPLWQEVHVTSGLTNAGATFIPCPTAINGELRVGNVIFVCDDNPLDFEIAEVQSLTSSGITVLAPLAKTWQLGAAIHPARKARLTDQPELKRESDDTVTAPVRFSVSEASPIYDTNISATLPDTYRGFKVLAFAPDENDNLNYGYERLTDEVDNMTSIPTRFDSAGIAFTTQTYSWVLNGHAEHRAFRGLLGYLRGRVCPFWMPTFFQDAILGADINSGSSRLNVQPFGFLANGGPSLGRQDVMLELVDGSRLYRRITGASTLSSGLESLIVDSPFPAAIAQNDVLRISFMALSRLDQDAIEIAHKTDTAGVSICTVTCRSAPDLRVAAAVT